METQQRSIVWEWCDRPGIEHLLLALDGDGSRADGIVVVGLEDAILRLRYGIACDAQWRFRTATIAAESNGETRQRRVPDGPHHRGAARPAAHHTRSTARATAFPPPRHRVARP